MRTVRRSVMSPSVFVALSDVRLRCYRSTIHGSHPSVRITGGANTAIGKLNRPRFKRWRFVENVQRTLRQFCSCFIKETHLRPGNFYCVLIMQLHRVRAYRAAVDQREACPFHMGDVISVGAAGDHRDLNPGTADLGQVFCQIQSLACGRAGQYL